MFESFRDFSQQQENMTWGILMLLIFTLCVSGSFVVNVTQTSYQAQKNHNITLEWTFTKETGRSSEHLNIYCELITDDKLSVLYHVHEGIEVSESQDKTFSGRVQSDKDALKEGRIRLQLCRLGTQDSGRYRCQVNTVHGFSSANCRLTVTVPAKQLQPPRPTLPPKEKTEDWKIILIGFTAVVLLALLVVCTLLCIAFRKNFCAAVKFHKITRTESQKKKITLPFFE